MPHKKATIIPFDGPANRKQLEALYARRSAINAVIRSLEVYDRHRAKSLVDVPNRKTA